MRETTERLQMRLTGSELLAIMRRARDAKTAAQYVVRGVVLKADAETRDGVTLETKWFGLDNPQLWSSKNDYDNAEADVDDAGHCVNSSCIR